MNSEHLKVLQSVVATLEEANDRNKQQYSMEITDQKGTRVEQVTKEAFQAFAIDYALESLGLLLEQEAE